MLQDMILAACIVLPVLAILWILRGVLLTPVPRGKNVILALRLTVTGPEPKLEQTVNGLLWLLENETLSGRIEIEDAGMDGETRAVARRLAAHTKVDLIRNEKYGQSCPID